jgi:hypothetical protein
MLTIAAGEATGDLGAEDDRGFLQRRESDEEAEEATRKAETATCFCEKEKSLKEVTRCIWGAGPWSLNQIW